jgi:hypothetical protein
MQALLINQEPNLPITKEHIEMLDYRLHYPNLVPEERLRGVRDHAEVANRGVRRIFRIASSRPAGREMGRR